MLDEYRDGMLLARKRDELANHIDSCADCKKALAELELLGAALRNMKIEPPRDNFAADVVAMASGGKKSSVSANRTGNIHRFGFGIAGALAAGLLALGVVLYVPPSSHQVSEAGFSVSLYQPRKISLAFNSPADIRGVTVSVVLPKDFEVVGHEGRRSLKWTTNLKKGRNILTLPVIAKGEGKGLMVTRLSRNKETKTVQVMLTTRKSGLSGNRILNEIVA